MNWEKMFYGMFLALGFGILLFFIKAVSDFQTAVLVGIIIMWVNQAELERDVKKLDEKLDELEGK